MGTAAVIRREPEYKERMQQGVWVMDMMDDIDGDTPG